VNHTADEVVCRGANFRTGDPTYATSLLQSVQRRNTKHGISIHGEISAINACTAVFEARNMTPTEIFAAWADLSICT